MTEHWNWAIRQALEISQFSHISYLTDRMMFLKNSLQNLQKILTEYPDDIVSYSMSSIDDSKMPVSLNEFLWTGKLFEISSLKVLKQYAESDIINNFGLPKMLNSVAPRDHIQAMLKKYGDVFSSISPDYNFAFRSLSMVESTLYYDKSLIVSYGVSRSNGGNMTKGIFNKDVKDFISNLSSVDLDLGFESPITHFCVLPNCIIYEYQYAKEKEKMMNFPKVNQYKYLSSLVDNVLSFGNQEMREEMVKLLRSKLGYSFITHRAQGLLLRKSKGLKFKLYNLFNSSNPYILTKNFENLEEAIEYVNDSPRKPVSHFELLDYRTGGKPSARGAVRVLTDVPDLA